MCKYILFMKKYVNIDDIFFLLFMLLLLISENNERIIFVMKIKRTTCIILLLSILVSFLACAEEGVLLTTETGETAAAETETETAPETDLKDNLPEADYGGSLFNILAAAEQWQHFYNSEQTGDVVNDAVCARNAAIEERFNIKLIYHVFNGYSAGLAGVKTALSESVMSGSGDYDLLVGSVSYVTQRIADNLFADLNALPYIDFEKPWWHGYVNDELELFGKLYLGAGYYGMLSMSWSVVTFFNKKIAEDFNLGNMYEIVNNGTWTMEKLISLSGKVTDDLNGDDKFNEQDRIGLLSTWDYMSFLGTSMDYYYTERDGEGVITLTGANEKIIKINEYLYNLYKSDSYLDGNDIKPTVDIYTDMRSAFASDHALFMIHRLEFSEKAEMRDMEQYGIIPTPKYDEAQDRYITPVVNEVAGIPYVVHDSEISAILLEALTAETYRTVRPAYFDIALMRKYSRDDDSNVMLDMIMKNTSTDFCYMFLDAVGSDLFYTIGKEENYTSWMAANESKYTSSINKYIDKIKEMN